jgi:DNA repair photolyase
MPVHFDTYHGCTHGCKYCFASIRKKSNVSNVRPHEGPQALKNFIDGKRTRKTLWADWDIPLHWGAMSDPLQPAEKQHRRTYECMQILRDTGYPYVISTKGALAGSDEYLDLMAGGNCVLQVSVVCRAYDKLEPGCPTFDERVEIMSKAAKRLRRVIARMQPYMIGHLKECMDALDAFAKAGIHGVILEGVKLSKKFAGAVKLGGDWVYPLAVLRSDFAALRAKAHSLGLAFYSGENRLRKMGDSLTCCGVADLEGFTPNTYNLNHILLGEEKVTPTPAMLTPGSGGPFRTLSQTTSAGGLWSKGSLQGNMLRYLDEKRGLVMSTFGLNGRKNA